MKLERRTYSSTREVIWISSDDDDPVITSVGRTPNSFRRTSTTENARRDQRKLTNTESEQRLESKAKSSAKDKSAGKRKEELVELKKRGL